MFNLDINKLEKELDKQAEIRTLELQRQVQSHNLELNKLGWPVVESTIDHPTISLLSIWHYGDNNQKRVRFFLRSGGWVETERLHSEDARHFYNFIINSHKGINTPDDKKFFKSIKLSIWKEF